MDLLEDRTGASSDIRLGEEGILPSPLGYKREEGHRQENARGGATSPFPWIGNFWLTLPLDEFSPNAYTPV